jgi:hypothetical protein
LQIAVKIVNNLAGLDSIVLTLLVFSIYLQFTEIDLLLLSVTKRTEAIYITTKKVCYLYTKKYIKNILTVYNRPDTKIILDLFF